MYTRMQVIYSAVCLTMSTEPTFLTVSQSESMNSIDWHASSQSWAWSNVILVLCVYHRSVTVVTKYKDFIHFTALHIIYPQLQKNSKN